MHQMLSLRLRPLLTRLILIVLAVAILPLLSGMPAYAEQPTLSDGPDRNEKADGKSVAVTQVQPDPDPAQAPVITELPGSRAAGAKWAEPWQENGPKIIDTRRPAPPAAEVTPRSEPDLSEQTDVPSTVPLPGFDADIIYYDTPYYPLALFPPQGFGFLDPFDTGRFERPFPTGRGIILAGRHFRGHRGFHKFHPSFRKFHPGFRKFHPGFRKFHGFRGHGFRRFHGFHGFRGHGFRGHGFRGRGFRGHGFRGR